MIAVGLHYIGLFQGKSNITDIVAWSAAWMACDHEAEIVAARERNDQNTQPPKAEEQ